MTEHTEHSSSRVYYTSTESDTTTLHDPFILEQKLEVYQEEEEEITEEDLKVLEKFRNATSSSFIPFVVAENPCDPTTRQLQMAVMKRISAAPSDSQLHLALTELSNFSEECKKVGKKVHIGEEDFLIQQKIFEASNFVIYMVLNEYSEEIMTLKVCAFSSAWEYFVLYMINSRLKDVTLLPVPRPISCDVFKNESLLLMESVSSCEHYYSIQDVICRSAETEFGAFGGGIDELLAMFWALRILESVQTLIFDANILHNNIRPGTMTINIFRKLHHSEWGYRRPS